MIHITIKQAHDILMKTVSSFCRDRTMWLVILLFAAANGINYALLLPLWEGFDEPFHYSYVVELATKQTVPKLARSTLSTEIWQSLTFAPASHVVQRNIPELKTYGQYFALSDQDRHELRSQLENIPVSYRGVPDPIHGNYEAHQPPVAYMLMAIPDGALSRCSLLTRIRALRIFVVIFGIALTACGTLALCGEIGADGAFQWAALLMIFSCQMYYATTARVANDWLAIPLAIWTIVTATRTWANPCWRTLIHFSSTLALGLLTKAYFLALIPFFLGLIVLLCASRRLSVRIAIGATLAAGIVPTAWYARNFALYRSISAVPETVAGIGLAQVAGALFEVPWLGSAAYIARGSLWTGNNQFNTFSRPTLDIALVLLFVGWVLLARHSARRKEERHKVIIVSLVALSFVAALAYSTAVSFIYSHGASAGASPWYAEVLLPPAIVGAMAGLARSRLLGRILAMLQVVLWTYIMLASYLAKLIPQYGGRAAGATHVSELVAWYTQDPHQIADILGTTALGPMTAILVLTPLVFIMGLISAGLVCTELMRSKDTST